MSKKNVLSFVFNVHLPFIKEADPKFFYEEIPFFELISLSFIPFIEMLGRLEAERIPFRIALVMPTLLCQLLTDDMLVKRYLSYVDKQIAFGQKEMLRCRNRPRLLKLAQYYYERALEHKFLFVERYRKNIPEVISHYEKHGKLEIIATAAINAYLPFYINYPSSISAQIETALLSHKRFFKERPQGFWLPEMAYCKNLDRIIRTYGFSWTIVDTHTALLSRPYPEDGSFYPLKTQNGLCLLVKDFYAHRDIMHKDAGLPCNPAFRSYFDDAGFELRKSCIADFISARGVRLATGYKYYTKKQSGKSKETYNLDKAAEAAKEAAKEFLQNRVASLSEARENINKTPLSLSVLPFDFFGRFWYEGWTFVEEVFRSGANIADIEFMTPSVYLYKENASAFQRISPEYSSSGPNGYAEAYLDSSNVAIYRHLLRSVERMIEISERFGEETDVRERVLNQAAREILLATDADWARFAEDGEQYVFSEWRRYAQNKLKTHLRNFTTLYESLGNSQLSTRFLTDLECKDNAFPNINYRSFKRKKKLEYVGRT
jgi:1,4-alpha-glucan branching enzyme